MRQNQMLQLLLMTAMFSACSSATQVNSNQPVMVNTVQNAKVQVDPERGTVRFMQGNDLSAQLATDPDFIKMQTENRHADVALAFLQLIAKTLQLADPQRELVLKKVDRDDLGMAHVRFEQIYENIPVLRAEIVVHLNRTNQVTSLQGSYIPTPQGMNVDARLDKAAIQKIAVENVGISSCTGCESQLVIVPVTDKQLPTLGYQVMVSKGISGGWHLVIDANTGQVIEKISTVRNVVN